MVIVRAAVHLTNVRPEPAGVVGFNQVAKFVNHHVAHQVTRQEEQLATTSTHDDSIMEPKRAIDRDEFQRNFIEIRGELDGQP